MATPEPDDRKLSRHGLRYVHPGEPGYTRIRRGKGFVYVDQLGRPLPDKEIERVKAIVIPPAWQDVWICSDSHGHIQATGVDVAGRKQYRYAHRWRAMADAEKFEQMIDFARALPHLRRHVRRELTRENLDWDRMLCAALRILDCGSLRIGFEEYLEENETHGLVTLQRSHVTFEGASIVLEFLGKSSKEHKVKITDADLVATFQRLWQEDYTGTRLLSFRDGDLFYDFKATDINTYLEQILGGRFTAKSFRTWHATKSTALNLATEDLPASDTGRRRVMNQVVKQTSELLGNTPAVCRASYIDPRVFERWEDGAMVELRQAMQETPVRTLMSDRATNRLEAAVIGMLEGEDMLQTLTGQIPVVATRRRSALVSAR